MTVRLSEFQWDLLREIAWLGGVLVTLPGPEDWSYLGLITAGCIYCEPVGDGRLRYEINEVGIRLLASRSGLHCQMGVQQVEPSGLMADFTE